VNHRNLDDHAFLSIQDSRDRDEKVVTELGHFLCAAGTPGAELTQGFHAAHVVAAAAQRALAGSAPIPVVFDRMIGLLKRMHDANAAWGSRAATGASPTAFR
jgi:hypothetical protein